VPLHRRLRAATGGCHSATDYSRTREGGCAAGGHVKPCASELRDDNAARQVKACVGEIRLPEVARESSD